MESISGILTVITLTYLASIGKLISLHDAVWVGVIGCIAMVPPLVRAQLEHQKMLRRAGGAR